MKSGLWGAIRSWTELASFSLAQCNERSYPCQSGRIEGVHFVEDEYHADSDVQCNIKWRAHNDLIDQRKAMDMSSIRLAVLSILRAVSSRGHPMEFGFP